MERTWDLCRVLVPCPLTLAQPFPLPPLQFFFFFSATSLSASVPLTHLLYARVTATTNRGDVCVGAQTMWIQRDVITSPCHVSLQGTATVWFIWEMFWFFPRRHRMRRGFNYLTSPAQLLNKHMGKIMRRWGHASEWLQSSGPQSSWLTHKTGLASNLLILSLWTFYLFTIIVNIFKS